MFRVAVTVVRRIVAGFSGAVLVAGGIAEVVAIAGIVLGLMERSCHWSSWT
jgi:hypothetical protein